MPRHLRAVLVAALAIALPLAGHWRSRADGAPGAAGVHRDGTVEITREARAATFRFAPSMGARDRAWFLAAVASARPEARRLVAEVDGLVVVGGEPRDAALPGATAMGVTSVTAHGYDVWLNLAQLDGERVIDRESTVLHELGHVVDFALIPPETDAQLDAGIPPSPSCGQQRAWFGACAAAEERLADTFAKWALGGAVSEVGAGYGIPTPASLDDWGRPLGALAASLPAA